MRRLAQGHHNAQLGGAGDRTSNLAVTSGPALPPELMEVYAADVQLLTRPSDPDFPAAAREDLALDAFLRGCSSTLTQRYAHAVSSTQS